jgi:hypothetical protein
LEIANDSCDLSGGEIWFRVRNNLKIGWLQEGGSKTKLFHLHSHHRKRKTFIAKLVDGDHICTRHEDNALLLNIYYEEVLGSSMNMEQTINLSELGVPSFDLSELDARFTEEEIWAMIKGLPSDKAMWPDAFIGRFYKTC